MSQRFRDDPAARHAHDPGIHSSFAQAREGIILSRKGIKRLQELVKGDSGAREIALVRTKIDEAELWLQAAIHAVRSKPYPPPATVPFEWLYDAEPEDGIQEYGLLRADLADTPERAAVELSIRVAKAGWENVPFLPATGKVTRRAELPVYDDDEIVKTLRGRDAEREAGVYPDLLHDLRYFLCEPDDDGAVEWWYVPRKLDNP